MESINVLILTRSLVLQQGLGALLESIPAVTKVKTFKKLSAAEAWIEDHHPKLVLLDEDLIRTNPTTALKRISVLSPRTQRAILVNDEEEAPLFPDHAEAILIKGALPSTITRIVTEMLSAQGDEHASKE